jgi:hypothetical protein
MVRILFFRSKTGVIFAYFVNVIALLYVCVLNDSQNKNYGKFSNITNFAFAFYF